MRSENGSDQAGDAGTRSRTPIPQVFTARFGRRFSDFDPMPDLGSRIGTLTWYRGAATCIGLCALTLLLAPGLENPIYGTVPPKMTGAEFDATLAQSIRPLGDRKSTRLNSSHS